MGLTIHYSLGLPHNATVGTATKRLGELRSHALTLGLAEVSELRHFEGEACNYELYRDEGHPDHEWFWFLIQAGGRETPTEVIGFRTWPGDGCEEANFGLAKFRSSKNWGWSSFCKTQYANDPEYGGVAHFLKCHLAVISMLNRAKELRLLKSIHDEGEFWEKRSVEELIKEIGEWDNFIAAMAGKLKDAFGRDFEAPILERKDFEHLEARGVSQLEADKDHCHGGA